jgi:preprotein translocase subunit SecD
MFQNVKARLLLIAVVTALSVWAVVAKGIDYGLDLAGGIHLALEVDDRGVALTDEQRADALDRALKVVHMRIDESGTREASVQAGSGNRILVDYPGIDEAEQQRLKEIIQKTAFLEFQIVRPAQEMDELGTALDRAILAAGLAKADAAAGTPASPVPGLRPVRPDSGAAADSAAAPSGTPFTGKSVGRGYAGEVLMDTAQAKVVRGWLADPRVARAIPRGRELLWGVRNDEERPGVAALYLVETRPMVTGDHLEDAKANTDQLQQPVVEFELSARGGNIFRRATRDHINQPMAIVMDQQVYTAPTIRSEIGSRGQIELGGSTLEEAADLALVLRAGALPAPLRIAEERSVGPSLGEDSIAAGRLAGFVGLGLVVLIMVGIYRFSGFLSVAALVVYCAINLGLLAFLDAALTFPGIAGLILSVGMALDANVLIFERTREELDHGRSPRVAIMEGFHHALRAIIDSNVTSLITCAILYYTGTGPVRGFAVTLALGVISSMFTAIFVTRTLFMLYLERRTAAQGISI